MRVGKVGRLLLCGPALVVIALAGVAIDAQSPRPYAAPRTPWGDPDLQGAFTNSDESLIPFERPRRSRSF
jgi:hypothetical protein